MSLLSRLMRSVAEAIGHPSAKAADDPATAERLAAAALLIHVARVDGRCSDAERARLAGLVRARFALSGEEADRLIARAGEIDYEIGDVAALAAMIGHDAALAERRRLVAMAYEVAAADGRIHEFEESLVWRLGRLLGFSDSDVEAIRDCARSGRHPIL